MNRKVVKKVAERAGKATKSLFRGSSSSGSRREALLRCLEDERGEEENENNGGREEEENDNNDGRGEEENENNEDDDSGEDEDDNEVDVVRRQIRKSHVVAPPSVPVREDDKVLIKPFGDR